jgi:Helicase conserved C-terminal domain
VRACRIHYRRLDGTMTVSAREKAVADFESRDDVLCIIMSLKAASLGLNLVSANHVVLLDLWWNPTVEEQAIDRAHRIGQTRAVHVTRITVAGARHTHHHRRCRRPRPRLRRALRHRNWTRACGGGRAPLPVFSFVTRGGAALAPGVSLSGATGSVCLSVCRDGGGQDPGAAGAQAPGGGVRTGRRRRRRFKRIPPHAAGYRVHLWGGMTA